MKENNLTQGGILKSLMTFALPILAALFLQTMYGAADLIIVGKFAGTFEQSGVASGSHLLSLVTMVITGLCTGVTVFIGSAIGAQDPERAGRGVGTGIAIFAAAAVLITAFMVPGASMLAGWMDAPEEAFAQTASYIRVCGLGTVFIVAYNVIGAVFRGIGDSRTPLITVVIACLFNIAGDLILVGIFGLGALGAAIATVTAQAVSVLFSLYYIARRELPFQFRLSYIRFRKDAVIGILRIGTPVAFQELLVAFSFVFIQVLVNGRGVVDSAAVGVGEKVCGFLMLVASAYAQSISAFVAQNNGAGLYDRSRKALFYGMGTAFIAGLVTGGLAFFGGDLLASIFSSEAVVIEAAHDYLRSYAIDCLLTSVMFCMVGYFNGCGRTIFTMAQGIIGAFCVRIPLVYIISGVEGATLFHIGLGTPASSVVQIILCIFAYQYYKKAAE